MLGIELGSHVLQRTVEPRFHRSFGQTRLRRDLRNRHVAPESETQDDLLVLGQRASR
jgi:hypothetical protein